MRISQSKLSGAAVDAKRMEAELRKYNRDKRINSLQHLMNKIAPPKFEWSNNDWLKNSVRKKVGNEE